MWEVSLGGFSVGPTLWGSMWRGLRGVAAGGHFPPFTIRATTIECYRPGSLQNQAHCGSIPAPLLSVLLS